MYNSPQHKRRTLEIKIFDRQSFYPPTVNNLIPGAFDFIEKISGATRKRLCYSSKFNSNYSDARRRLKKLFFGRRLCKKSVDYRPIVGDVRSWQKEHDQATWNRYFYRLFAHVIGWDICCLITGTQRTSWYHPRSNQVILDMAAIRWIKSGSCDTIWSSAVAIGLRQQALFKLDLVI